MAIRLQRQDVPGGPYAEVDLAAARLFGFRLAVSYSSASKLTFSAHAANHTVPIPQGTFLRLWPDDATNPLTGLTFTADAPLFEGHVSEATPGGDGLTVRYTALDPTAKCSRDFRVMSLPWNAGVSGGPPTRAVGATSRIVFNADNILADEDAAHTRSVEASLGTIVATLLADQHYPLLANNAAPSAGAAYVWTGELEGLAYVPQEKQVFQDETLRSAILRVLQQEPCWRLIWYPGERRWRFGDVTQSPAVTLTLNDFSDANPHKVLSLDLNRGTEDRYGAVCFYGPARIENTVASTLPASAPSLLAQTYTPADLVPRYRYQIADPAKRRTAGVLAEPIYVNDARGTHVTADRISTWGVGAVQTWFPQIEARFPAGDSGDSGWYTFTGWWLDKLNGIVDLGTRKVERPIYPVPGSPPYAQDPEEVRFTYGRYVDPFRARYPAIDGTFEGTAHTEAGLANELSIYDEMLVVGTFYNVQITTATRLARFAELAERIHAEKKDLVYTGGLTLDGLDYEFAFLDRRVHLAAVDADGAPLVTGWEAIGAMVTDVEFDFSQQVTTVQFSSDKASLMGVDVEREKEELKIRAAEPVFWFNATVMVEKGLRTTAWGTSYFGMDTWVKVDFGVNWVDEEGEVQ